MLLKSFLLGIPFWICCIFLSTLLKKKIKSGLLIVGILSAFYLAAIGIFLHHYFNKNEYFMVMGAITFIGYVLSQIFLTNRKEKGKL